MCNWCFLCEGLTGTSSVCEKKNNPAKLFGVYRSVRLRVKPLVSPIATGIVGSLVKNLLMAEVGDTVRMYCFNAGPNLVASWHIIGEVFDRVYPEGSIKTIHEGLN